MANFHVFCDESYTEDTYRVQGGIWANHAGLRVIRSELTALRCKHAKAREFKWSKLRGKEPTRSYHDLVKIFFDSPAAPYLFFKCLVVHCADDPSRCLGKEERDLGFYKAYHLLLKYRLEPGCRYRIRLDKRTGPRVDPETDVADCLNAEICKWRPPAEVLSCIGVDSHAEDLMQMADVLCGAVGWEWNNRPSNAPAKAALAEEIAAKLDWRSLKRQTGGSAVKFNVWRYHPKEK